MQSYSTATPWMDLDNALNELRQVQKRKCYMDSLTREVKGLKCKV